MVQNPGNSQEKISREGLIYQKKLGFDLRDSLVSYPKTVLRDIWEMGVEIS
jgi:hypothetical protein